MDYGGSDVVDLRPLSTDDVYLSRRAFDGGTEESLQIVTGLNAQVILLGHYGPYSNFTSCCGQQGRIEKLIFADVTFTASDGLAAVTASADSTSSKQADLAAAADRLAEEASKLLAEQPKPGTPPAGVGRGGEVGPEPGGDVGKHQRAKDKKHTADTQGKHDKKAKKQGR